MEDGTLKSGHPLKTVGSFWPYATALWDYVNRTMPFDRPGTLTADEVYATVAYMLYVNGIVCEHEPLDKNNLAKVKMPNQDRVRPRPAARCWPAVPQETASTR